MLLIFVSTAYCVLWHCGVVSPSVPLWLCLCVLDPGPCCCCFASFSEGETQIWLGDLRVVWWLAGFDVLILPQILLLYRLVPRYVQFSLPLRLSSFQDRASELYRPHSKKLSGGNIKLQAKRAILNRNAAFHFTAFNSYLVTVAVFW